MAQEDILEAQPRSLQCHSKKRLLTGKY